MNMQKIRLAIFFVSSVVSAAFSASVPQSLIPLDFSMPCIDDSASSSMRGATGNERGARCAMRRQAAAPVQHFDEARFVQLINEFKAKPLELFLQKQNSSVLGMHIDKPYARFSCDMMQLSPLQYVARYATCCNEGPLMARILRRYGAHATYPLSYNKTQYPHSPVMIAKMRYWCHSIYAEGKQLPWGLRRLLIYGCPVKCLTAEEKAAVQACLPAAIDFFSASLLSDEQLAALRVGPEDGKYTMFKLLELFSGISETDALVEGLAKLPTDSSRRSRIGGV